MLREHLKERGVTNPRVLEVFREVPREKFVPPQFYDLSYEDSPLDIGSGQTISQPYTVAFMTQLLDPQPSDVVLEVGTGSGYQAAILSRLAKQIYTIERFEELGNKAKKVLRQLGYENVEMVIGDGSKGLPEKAPFDGIIVTAGAPRIPEPLIDQLAEGGRLVIPIGVGIQAMIKITKTKKGLKREEFPGFRFVPLVGRLGFARDDLFEPERPQSRRPERSRTGWAGGI
ncbi:MAG: protein-L-isoaspartate(D-aspartate) O-methyltransferase [candidate division WWE3 bacterium]|nr:protein-L-isoaspartate(D-aspartate) O-methyltransferase [candidate division WWE3 bacterium]